jgi:FtsK/SpoIIIE family
MAPATRTADSMWTQLGNAVSRSAPAVWLDENVRRNPTLTRTRTVTGGAWTRLLDICYPLIVVGRGTRIGLRKVADWWKNTPKEKRTLEGVVALVCVGCVGLLHLGPLLLVASFVGYASWLGRDTSKAGADPESKAHIGRLQAVYNGLVPYLQSADDPDQHFKPGGGYRDAFTEWEFDEADALVRLKLDYSQYFKDGEADSRAKVERALEGKIGQANEYLYSWDEQGNHLEVRILPPLLSGIGSQPWPVAEIEFVLGITDPGPDTRLIPVLVADPMADSAANEDTVTPLNQAPGTVPHGFTVTQVPPVIWRVVCPSATPHMLIVGGAGSGKSTVVRSLLAQALGRGHHVAVMDSDATAEYTDLVDRPGVLRITEEPIDSLALLDWFGLELERRAERFGAVDTSQDTGTALAGTGETAIEPPLWLFIDGLPELIEAAAALGRANPQDLLAGLARKARFAHTTLVTTARTEHVGKLRPALRSQLANRVALGKVDAVTSTTLFGGTLELGGGQAMPAGRGYARIGAGPVIRLQTPYAPTHVPTSG